MEKRHALALHVFRRDLRLEDNTALAAALRTSRETIPCFILDPRQLGPENRWRGDNSVRFMFDSLLELDAALRRRGSRLHVFFGRAEDVVGALLARLKADAVFTNRDHTRFSIARDDATRAVCEGRGAAFYSCPDALLHEPEDVLKADGGPYVVFTAFALRASSIPLAASCGAPEGCFFKGATGLEQPESVWRKLAPAPNPACPKGGRGEGLRLLERAALLDDYGDGRDFPARDATTRLSPHNKFGTVSPREVVRAFRENAGWGGEMTRQMLWRDFFCHVAFHFPRVFGAAFKEEFDAAEWTGGEAALKRWRAGATGFPIVDAGMRELASTGVMHNRVRMIAASFLVKDLRVDWREGERHFATMLADYDPAVNNGNWQWCASTGCDSQPYFRVFNPWLQQAKYDPDCEYVRRWVPELRGQPAKVIHGLHKTRSKIRSYPRPMVDHSVESRISREIFKALSAGKYRGV